MPDKKIIQVIGVDDERENNYNNPFETQKVFNSLLSTKLKEALTE